MSRILTSLAVVFLVAPITASAQEADRDDKTASDVSSGPITSTKPPSVYVPAYVPQPAIERPPQPAIERPVVQPAPVFLTPSQGPAVRWKTTVCRLKNVPAADVAESVNELLERQTQVRQAIPPQPYSQPVWQWVTVFPEPITNSLILNGPAEAIEEVLEVIEELDRPRSAVMVRLLIAEVTQVRAADPGAVRQPAEGTGDAETPNVIGLGDRSNFSVEAIRNELGLSSLPKEVEARIRGLGKDRRFVVLARPQLITLDNQPAFIHIGQREPIVRGSMAGRTGPVSQVSYENTGLNVGVTPRVSPDGRVTMELDVEQSQMHPDEGPVLAASPEAEVIRAARVTTTKLQTTVRLRDGETIVLGGLTTKSEARQSELLVIVNARIIRD
ncbi:MAG TPA: secretin N-terminal domain-containing protein [Thermoguttaceae bacterium]|nr:secretin N-terminal domain-containing protein [Thermoguttaceae bacterium]